MFSKRRKNPTRVLFIEQNETEGKINASLTSIKIEHLSPMVTNERLKEALSIFGEVERAVVIVNNQGKSTTKGIVEFNSELSAQNAVKQIQENCYFITRQPKPLTATFVQEDSIYGLSEEKIIKTTEYYEENSVEPRFGASFEEEIGKTWKMRYQLEQEQREQLEQHIIESRKIFEEQIANYWSEQQETMKRQHEMLPLENNEEEDKQDVEARKQIQMEAPNDVQINQTEDTDETPSKKVALPSTTSHNNFNEEIQVINDEEKIPNETGTEHRKQSLKVKKESQKWKKRGPYKKTVCETSSYSMLGMIDRSGSKQLTVAEKLAIIKKLEEKPKPASKRSIGRQFNVNESTIRRIWANRDVIRGGAESFSDEFKLKRRRIFKEMLSLDKSEEEDKQNVEARKQICSQMEAPDDVEINQTEDTDETPSKKIALPSTTSQNNFNEEIQVINDEEKIPNETGTEHRKQSLKVKKESQKRKKRGPYKKTVCETSSYSMLGMIDRSGSKQLTVAEKLAIIKKLEEKPKPASKRSIGRLFNVNESTIRRIWANRDVIRGGAESFSDEFKLKRRRIFREMLSLDKSEEEDKQNVEARKQIQMEAPDDVQINQTEDTDETPSKKVALPSTTSHNNFNEETQIINDEDKIPNETGTEHRKQSLKVKKESQKRKKRGPYKKTVCETSSYSMLGMIDRSGSKQLTVAEKLAIIKKLEEKPKPASKRSIGRQFNVNESTIRRVWANRDVIRGGAESFSDEFKLKRRRIFKGKSGTLS